MDFPHYMMAVHVLVVQSSQNIVSMSHIIGYKTIDIKYASVVEAVGFELNFP